MTSLAALIAACTTTSDTSLRQPSEVDGSSLPSGTTSVYATPTVAYGTPTLDVEWMPSSVYESPIHDQWIEAPVVGVFGATCVSTVLVTAVADDPTLFILMWFQEPPGVGAVYVMPSVITFAEDDRRSRVPLSIVVGDDSSFLMEGEVEVVEWSSSRWVFSFGGPGLMRCSFNPYGSVEACTPHAGGTMTVTPMEGHTLRETHDLCIGDGEPYPWDDGSTGCVTQFNNGNADCPDDLWP